MLILKQFEIMNMENTDKIYSFIIPHHNCPNLLYRLLDTIPMREDIEIIVVDDNSDVDKVPIINRSDVQLFSIPASESKGAGHARNVGLDHATGKWLLFADSDDYFVEGFISVLDKYKESEIDILYYNCYSELSNSDQKTILEQYLMSEHTHHDRCVLGFSINAPWNKMFRREFVQIVGERFEEIPSSNDAWFTNIMAVKSRHIAVDTNILYRYVNNPRGITQKVRPISDRYIVLNSIIKRNKLKFENGCIQLIDCSLFPNIFLRDYGLIKTTVYLFKRIIRDKYLRKAILNKLFL